MGIRGRPCYVYCIVREADVVPDPHADVAGVDGAAVSIVGGAGLAAIVSAVAAADVQPRRADVLAHAAVLDAVVGTRDVLPLRFGTVLADEDAVVVELLSEGEINSS